jgi:hypothetical protein
MAWVNKTRDIESSEWTAMQGDVQPLASLLKICRHAINPGMQQNLAGQQSPAKDGVLLA